MSTIKQISDPQRQLTLLNQETIDKNEQAELALTLLGTFGPRHFKLIQIQLAQKGLLNEKMPGKRGSPGEYTKIYAVFTEFQKKLNPNNNAYNQDTFSTVSRVIPGKFRGAAEDYFVHLKHRYYAVLSSPQLIRESEGKELEKYLTPAKKARELGLKVLFSRLSPRAIEEKKIGDEEGLSSEETIALLRLYSCGAALVFGGEKIAFSDLLHMWRESSEENENSARLLLEELPALAKWIDDQPYPVHHLRQLLRGQSFREFLVDSTIEALQNSLDLKMLPSDVQYLKDLFLNDEVLLSKIKKEIELIEDSGVRQEAQGQLEELPAEQLRSDFCYFTEDLEKFYQMDLGILEGELLSYLRLLQIYLFLERSLGVQKEHKPALFSILLHANERWAVVMEEGQLRPIWQTSEFKNRRWDTSVPQADKFIRGLEFLRLMITLILKRNEEDAVSFEKPTESDAKLFKNPYFSALIFCFWKSPQMETFWKLFSALAQHDSFNLDLEEDPLKLIYDFCEINEAEGSRDFSGEFLTIYNNVMDVLAERGIYVRKQTPRIAKQIFFETPLKFNFDYFHLSQPYSEYTDRFIKEAAKCDLPVDQNYFAKLRAFIFSPKTLPFEKIVLEFGGDPRFNLTQDGKFFGVVDTFCQAHNGRLNSGFIGLLVRVYIEILEKFTKRNIFAIQGAEQLFLSPPLPLDESSLGPTMTLLARATGNPDESDGLVDKFIEGMQAYNLPIDQTYFQILRQYIFNPSGSFFALFEDASQLGIRSVNSHFLERVIIGAPKELGGEISEETRAWAIKETQKIQKRYKFDDIAIFTLYLEMIHLKNTNNAKTFRGARLLIEKLANFCPALSKDAVYLLYRYHPNVPIKVIDQLVEFRNSWATEDGITKRFVMPKKHLDKALNEADRIAKMLAAGCKDEEASLKLEHTCYESLTFAFLPAPQPIVDHLTIEDLQVEGAFWKDAHLRTHLGEITPMFEGASLGVYFHWGTYQGCPVLYINFIDMKKSVGHAAFVVADINISELHGIGRSKEFCKLIRELSPIVMREETDESLDLSLPEDTNAWVNCFKKAKEIIDSYSEVFRPEQMQIILDFLKELKITYRNLFLSAISGKSALMDESEEEILIAARGNVFLGEGRGSLLPNAPDVWDDHPKYFTPDVTDAYMRNRSFLFSETTLHSRPLGVSLEVPFGSFPIFCKVQTPEQIKGDEEEKKGENQFQTRYVTLSFEDTRPDKRYVEATRSVTLKYPEHCFRDTEALQHRFNFHNLFLKAAAYQIEYGTLDTRNKEPIESKENS